MTAVTLAAVGDISFGRLDVGKVLAGHSSDWYFSEVAAALAAADVRFGNMESVLLGSDFPADKLNPRALQSSDQAVELLKCLNFDVLNQASNHTLDCGRVGLVNTFEKITALGAQPLGAGPDGQIARQMRVVETRGLKIGFIGYQEPCNWILEGGDGRVSLFNLDWALADIARCSSSVDSLVVSLHAGLEFQNAPSVPRVADCRAMIDGGADIVLCHHPHVPQGVEFYGDGLIAYSLGNFSFKVGDYLRNCGGEHVYRSTVLKIDIDSSGQPVEFRRENFAIDGDTGRPVSLDAEKAREAQAHHDYLDELVADDDKLRSCWYESSLKYLAQNWPQIVKSTPENFIRDIGWRLLCLPENRNWTSGLLEMAEQYYSDNSSGDYEYNRPNHPFETTGVAAN